MELDRITTPVNNEDTSHEIEIDLYDLMHFMLRKARYLCIAAIIGALAAAAYVFIFATPLYEATAQLYVVNSKDSALDLSDLQIGTYLTSDYELVFNTWEVNQQVKNNLGLDYTIKEMRNMVSVTNPNNTRALFITVTSPDPDEATLMANEYTEVAKQYIFDTMLSEMPTTLSVALTPDKPVYPRRLMGTLLGMLFGLLICAGILIVLYLRDDKVKTPADLMKYTGAMPLAVIPVIDTGSHHRSVHTMPKERRVR